MANETILIVDAETKSQKVLEVSFKKAGYRVEITDSIAAAREFLEDQTPSLIIANTDLPDGDGLEFCADLNLDDDTRDVPLIFLTRERSLDQKMRSFELGADDYLTKPIYINEVTTRAELLIQRKTKEKLQKSDVEQFEGDLDDITMIDLLQTIEEELRSGSIRVYRDGKQAAVYFHQGNILDAVCGKLQGEEAVYRTMRWSEGHFVVRYHDNVRRSDHVEKDTGTLLMEGMQRLDRWNELLDELPELDRVFEADYESLPGLVGSIPPEVERILRLFDGYRSLEQVIDDSPVADNTTLQVIGKLLDDDLLIDVTDAGSDEAPRPSGDDRRAETNLDDWLGTEGEAPSAETPFSTAEDARRDFAQGEDPDEDTDRITKPPVGEFEEGPETESGLGADGAPKRDTETDGDRRETPPPEQHQEPDSGGGHWQFHWDEDSSAQEARAEKSRTDTGDPSDEDQPDSIRKLEQQEIKRRQEEARRLAQQREQPEGDEEVVAPAGDEPFAESADSSTTEARRDEGRTRKSTPISAPAVGAAEENEESEDPDAGDQPVADPTEADEPEARKRREQATTTPLGVPDHIKEAEGIKQPDSSETDGPQQDAEDSEPDSRTDDQEDEPKSVDEPVAETEESTDETTDEPDESALEADEATGEPDEPVEEADEATDEPDEPVEETDESTDQIHKKFDETVTETTDEHSPPELVAEATPLVKPHAENGKVLSAEYDLTDSPAPAPPNTIRETARDEGEYTFESEGSTAAGELTEMLDEESADELARVAGGAEPAEDEEETEQGEPVEADDQQPIETDDEPADPDRQNSDEATEAVEQPRDPDPEDKDDLDVEAPEATETEEADEPTAQQTDSETEDEPQLDDEAPLWGDEQSPVGEASASSGGEWERFEEPEPSPDIDQSDDQPAETDEPDDDPSDTDDDSEEVDETESSFFEEGEQLEEFDEDFEQQFKESTTSWRLPLVAAGLAVVGAVVLAVLLVTDDPDEPPAEPDETAEATEPTEEAGDEVVTVGDEPDEDPQPDEAPEQLDEEPGEIDEETIEEVESMARTRGIPVEFFAEDVAEDIDDRLAELEEAEEEPQPADEQPVEEQPADDEPVADDEPDEPTVDEQIAELRSLVDQESPQALSLARQLNERAGGNPTVAFLHGRAAYEQGEDQEALDQFSRAEQLGFTSAELYLQMGNTHFALQQRDQAREAYEQFLETAPDHPRADEIENILDTL